MLTCKGCGRQLPAEGFHRRKASTTGRTSSCRDCANAAARKRRLAHKANDAPVNLDYVYLLCQRLSPQDQRHLWEMMRPGALASQLFREPDSFTESVRAINNAGGGMRLVSL